MDIFTCTNIIFMLVRAGEVARGSSLPWGEHLQQQVCTPKAHYVVVGFYESVITMKIQGHLYVNNYNNLAVGSECTLHAGGWCVLLLN